MLISDCGVVAALRQAIAQRIGEPRFKLWFDPHTKFTWENDHLTVGVPNRFFQEWLQNTFTEDVRAAAGEVLGRAMQVQFAIDAELFQAARREQAAPKQRAEPVLDAGKSQRTQDALRATDPRSEQAHRQRSGTSPGRTRRWRRLNEFVSGPCSRVAYASAVSIVEQPGQAANPLVLHGPIGTGKTHLLEGIYGGLRRGHPDWRVCYCTAEEFTHRFVQAMRLNKLGAFRKQFREADALLLDDLHFLATKRATQEEFLHTCDALLADGRQLVVACDCHPRLAEELSPQLIDRLLGGAVWPLAPPDFDTRLEILRARVAAAGEPAVGDDVLQLLAEQLRGNVRELEGALHSVQHYSRVAGRAADLSLAREAIAELLRHAVRVAQLPDIDRAVCQVLRLEAGALQSKQRSWAVSHPRMLAMFLARKHTAAAYSEIGRHFGSRNHSTAVAAEKKVRSWLQNRGTLSLGERQLGVREIIELVERELQR